MINFKTEYVTYSELTRAYHECRKRKRRTSNALDFEIDDALKLYNLWIDLNTKKYEIGRSIAFCVDHPVKREVFAADFRDRIIHHLVINRVEKYFEEFFIEDSYSCRKGKGTSFGVEQCEKYIREASEDYTVFTIIVKGDLKSYFMTINKEILYEKLYEFLCEKWEYHDIDRDYTLWLMKKIIDNRPQDNCIRKQPLKCWIGLPPEKSLFSCPSALGLPIGNLTSQIFANFYLSEFDYFMKEELGIKYYGRYVDDFFFLVHSAEEATEILGKCREKLKSMGITLHPKKLYIQDVKKGVKFIGAMIKPNRTYVSNRTKGNFWNALKKHSEYLDKILERGDEPTKGEIEHFVGSINSYLGFLVHYRTFNIRKKLLFSEFMRKWYKYCYVDPDLRKLTIYRDYSIYKAKKKGKPTRYTKEGYIRYNKFGELRQKFGDLANIVVVT